MNRRSAACSVAACLATVLGLAGSARAQTEPEVFSELQPLNPHKLSFDEAKALLTGARISRQNRGGSNQWWVNEPGGDMFVNTDNRDSGNRSATTAPAKWRVAPDGRFCMDITWRRVDPENWCRYVYKAGDSYYTSSTDSTATARVFKLKIDK